MSAPDSGADHDPSPDPGRELDRADMLRLAGGRESALDDLMARHGGRLHGCLRRLLQDDLTTQLNPLARVAAIQESGSHRTSFCISRRQRSKTTSSQCCWSTQISSALRSSGLTPLGSSP